jgi:hypothetical protein
MAEEGLEETKSYSDAYRQSREFTSVCTHEGFFGRQTESWAKYNSKLISYQHTFGEVLSGETKTIPSLLQGKKDPIVVDLMASPSAIRELFLYTDGESKHGVAVSLADKRWKFRQKTDQRMGIEQLTGDFTQKAAWDNLEDTVGVGKADLIMERALLGLEVLPQHRSYWQYAMARTWRLLSPLNGHLLLQLPSNLQAQGINMKDWTEALTKADIQNWYAPQTDVRGVLHIVKTPSSPLALPGITTTSNS